MFSYGMTSCGRLCAFIIIKYNKLHLFWDVKIPTFASCLTFSLNHSVRMLPDLT